MPLHLQKASLTDIESESELKDNQNEYQRGRNRKKDFISEMSSHFVERIWYNCTEFHFLLQPRCIKCIRPQREITIRSRSQPQKLSLPWKMQNQITAKIEQQERKTSQNRNVIATLKEQQNVGIHGFVAYSATKFGLGGLADGLRLFWIILVASCAALVIQSMAANLGVVTST
ncbi:hypothetical protein Fmac_024930 [Flemingia macrophylla]|uniref:Uncharacterized protein n=1 Tax=Flemingia macrophylla TaxID=520843 RepID=A0ABD1LQS6_9FABA